MKLNHIQQARIYCIKHGHAKYIFKCWGYIHCGRCSDQIGDQLGSIFDTRNLAVIGHKCSKCIAIYKKLKPFDKKIFNRLTKDTSQTHDKILKGIELK